MPAPTPPDAPFKPAVWRTGAAVSAPAPAPAIVPPPAHAALVVPAEADDDVAAGYVDLVERVLVAAPVEPPADADFAALERALSERILQQLTPRVEALVAERLDQVLQGLASSLRDGLGESIAQAVSASVRQELASLRAQKR